VATVTTATVVDGRNLSRARLSAKQNFAGGPPLSRVRHSAKAALSRKIFYRVPQELTLGKDGLCRVPEKRHLAKYFALGKIFYSLLLTKMAKCMFRIMVVRPMRHALRDSYVVCGGLPSSFWCTHATYAARKVLRCGYILWLC